MIVRPDATATEDIFLLEAWQRPVDGAVRPVYTEIDRVFLLCNICEQGPCEIDYWIRDRENITVGCQQCPQWKCDGDCVGEAAPRIVSPYSGFAVPVVPSPYSGFAVPVDPSPYNGFAAPVAQHVYSEQSDSDSESLVLALTQIQYNNKEYV